jgi:hypothetical protein
MIATSKNLSIPLVLSNQGKCSMAADIVESGQATLVLDDEERIASHFKLDIIANINKAAFVRYLKPFLREDSSPLELIKLR